MALALAGVVVAAMVFIGGRPVGGGGASKDVRTVKGFGHVLYFVDMLQDDSYPSASQAPLTGKELSQWISKNPRNRNNYIFDMLAIDLVTEGNTIQDAWGHDIRVIAVDGELCALASTGSNGAWEHGFGDNIIVSREVVTVGGAPATLKPLAH